MSAPPDFLRVPEHVARNQVARAVERARVQQVLRSFQIRLYTMPAGTDVSGEILISARILAVAQSLLDHGGVVDSLDGQLLTAASEALLRCSQRGGLWDPAEATPIDFGLSQATAIMAASTALEIQQAHRRVEALDAAALLGTRQAAQPAAQPAAQEAAEPPAAVQWPFPSTTQAAAMSGPAYTPNRLAVLDDLPEAPL